MKQACLYFHGTALTYLAVAGYLDFEWMGLKRPTTQPSVRIEQFGIYYHF